MKYSLLVAVALSAVACLALVSARIVQLPERPPARAKNRPDKLLVLVHAVCRHGERTPADTYPNDPYINETFYPFDWGQLTNNGRMQLYKTGELLRQRYDELLGPLYTPDSTHAQSTDTARARMSASLALAGLWPPARTALDWNPALDWQPIPVLAEPLNEDSLLLVRKPCPRYYEEWEAVQATGEVGRMLKEHAPLFAKLSNVTGSNITNLDDAQSLYSTLRAEEDYGLQLPDWTREYYPEPLLSMTKESFIVNTYNNELKRLKGGVLLKKILQDWVSEAAGTTSPAGRKVFAYAGHDSTVANLARALDVWDPQWPGYAIMLLLELYRDMQTGDYGVEVFLRNTTMVEPYPLTIPGCTHHCPLAKVLELTQEATPVDWALECQSLDPDYEPPAAAGP